MRRLKDTDGQTMVFFVVFLAFLLGISALSIDIGYWWKTKRDMQRTADAAALAGAQGLPDTTQATSLAMQYATDNGTTLAPGDITFSTDQTTNDTITIYAHGSAQGFFSKVFGVDSVSVGAHAAARSEVLDQAMYAAPIAVDYSHPYLSGSGCPCFNQPTSLNLTKVGPGAFRLLNLDNSFGGTGQTIIANWIMSGYDGWMDVGQYYSDSGAKFNANQIDAALDNRIGDELLFPVYDTTQKQGSNFQYHVIGWVGFHLTGYDASGNDGNVYGWFTRVIWHGLQGSPGRTTDLGDRAVQLVN
jgi:Flp pilus assembly protein TadG